jgi:hypothetical protein
MSDGRFAGFPGFAGFFWPLGGPSELMSRSGGFFIWRATQVMLGARSAEKNLENLRNLRARKSVMLRAETSPGNV